MTSKGSDTIRKCGFDGVSRYGLLEEMCHGVGVVLRSPMLKLCPVRQFTSCCLLIKMSNSELLLQHQVCLQATMSHHDDNGLNL